eukprot:GILJ01033248.1.p1 GENE.GILJ01033248.1~~GILJ01033248.1.p1  ORF type:complete len:152 (+),score=10.37 GILJ01033248.1:804-1259(+)
MKKFAKKKNEKLALRLKRAREKDITEQHSSIAFLANEVVTDDDQLPWTVQPLAVRILIGHLQKKYNNATALSIIFNCDPQTIRNDARDFHDSIAKFNVGETPGRKSDKRTALMRVLPLVRDTWKMNHQSHEDPTTRQLHFALGECQLRSSA